jgi:DNA repair exonuclease SbcCD ATPase subunit
MEAIVVDVESAKQILQNLTDEIKKVERESGKLAKYITALDTLKQRIENFRKDFEELEAESSASLKKLGIDFGDIIKLEVKTAPLVELRKKYHKERKELETKLDPDDEGSLIKQQQTIEKKISKLNATLDEPNKKYAEFEKALRKWQEKKDEIMGSDDVVGSLKYIEGQLASLLNLPDKLKEAKLRRDNIVKIIFSKISELADIYRTAYQPVQRFIEKHKLAMDRFNLNFQVSIVDVNFREVFLDKINQRVSGSFMRADDAREKLSKLFAKYDLNKEGDIILLLNEIVDNLTIDKSINPPRKNSVQNQLKKGTTVTELYDYLFSLSYLKPKYSLTLGDKQLSQLSPGEKGMLLLVFYLLVDKDTIPLILDQPEENLDNQTVYEVLVPCIKEAKNKRQIVIVTHNPNLAVVCDADQIICAKHDKKDNEKVTCRRPVVFPTQGHKYSPG